MDLLNMLKLHKKWINGELGGVRADLSEANLSGADLRVADLRVANLYGANLYGANLRGANLYGANLYGADLRGANLYGANLYGADLRGANLYRADLNGANLRGADLRGANLRRADLNGADLHKADLYEADLYGADLHKADLYEANLYGADLRGAQNIPYIPMICPEVGAFYAYKKVDKYIIKLYIPTNALRSSATTRKCRCEYAKVISITNLDGSKSALTKLTNFNYNKTTQYIVNDYVYPDSFDIDRWNECSHGIHFFLNRQEAVNY